MADLVTEMRPAAAAPAPARVYYGWFMVGLAALAMVGTLPGRTQGVGLITEALLRELRLERVTFAEMNLGATLLGSLFCIGFGRWQDRWGSRRVLTVTALCLGAVVLSMSATHSVAVLFALLTLSRGFGQSALSVVSVTLVGQWFQGRLPIAMGLYSLLLSIGFMMAFPLVGSAVLDHGWREAWSMVGGCLVLGLAPLSALFARGRPEDCGCAMEGSAGAAAEPDGAAFTWAQALRTPAFWVFAVASATYNLVASGIGLFNESILAERGFAPTVYHRSLVITALASLAGNALGGWLARRWSMSRLLALALALLSGALWSLPWLRTVPQVDGFATVMGLAGGVVIVIFFSFWPRAYGRLELGRIQGTAQMLTVLASALGPLLLAKGQAWTGSYAASFYALAAFIAGLGWITWWLPEPKAS